MKSSYILIKKKKLYKFLKAVIKLIIDFYDELNKKDNEIALLKRKLKEAEKQSASDRATGLLNKEAFKDRVTQMTSPSEDSLVIIDIDNFKLINDEHGHNFGDKIIERLAEILKQSLHGDDLIGRFGGDEFILFLRNVNAEIALKLIEKLRKKCESNEFPIKFSAGITEYNPNISYDENFKVADQALYESKEHGKNNSTILLHDHNKTI